MTPIDVIMEMRDYAFERTGAMGVLIPVYTWATYPPSDFGMDGFFLWASSMGYTKVNKLLGYAESVSITPNNQTGKFSIAFTTLHEIGHVLTPKDAHHGEQWIAACLSLGIKATPHDTGKRQENPERWDPALYTKVAGLEMQWP